MILIPKKKCKSDYMLVVIMNKIQKHIYIISRQKRHKSVVFANEKVTIIYESKIIYKQKKSVGADASVRL